MNELLDRVAFKLQHLSVRSRHIHTIQRYCCFHSSIEQFIPRFNAHLSSKIIHFCDDISGATKSQTKKIFPLVTAAKRAYEAKGQPVVVMRDHSELWITGNTSAGSLYVSSEDRRVIMYEANPQLKNDRAFWNTQSSMTQTLGTHGLCF